MESRSDFPYRVVVEYSDEDGAFVARVPALEGCAAHGDTPAEAAREAVEAARGILEALAAHREQAPEPDAGRDYSGVLSLRLPKYLHERLARRAGLEGVSMNQLMVALLAEATGSARSSYPVTAPRLAVAAGGAARYATAGRRGRKK